MNTNKKIILALAAVIVLLILFIVGCPGKKQPPPITARPVEVIRKEVIKDSARTREVLDSMKRLEAKWKAKAAQAGVSLKNADRLANDLLSEIDNNVSMLQDTGKQTLQRNINQYAAINKTKDSLCTVALTAKDSVIANVEGQSSAKDELYSKLRSSFNEVATGSNEKDKVISFYKKQVRKKKFGNVVWKIAAAGLTIALVNEKLK